MGNIRKNIIIIGAGPAGLTAGYELLKKGYKVTVLEVDPKYVGGISRTVKYKDYRFDIGGHRFFSKNKKIQKWWEQMLGEDFLKRPRLSRWYYRGKFFNYPINIFEIVRKFGLVFSFRVLFSYLWRRLFPIKPDDNQEAYYRNQFGDFLAKPFFIDYNLKLWGLPSRKLSTDFAKQRVKGVSMRKTILESLKKTIGIKQGDIKSFINTFNYPKYGPGQLWEQVAKKIRQMGGEILMDHEVIKVNLSSDQGQIKSITVKTNGSEKEIYGDIFLSTMPYKDLVLSVQPQLPQRVIKAAKALKFRDFVIVALVIKNRDICEDNWVYTHDKGMKPIRFQNFKNWSPYLVPNQKESVIGMEYTCTFKDKFWQLSRDKLIERGIKDFLKLGFVKRKSIKDASIIKMRNVYPVYDLGYQGRLKIIRKELDKISNLYCLGRGGIHRYNNTDHSMMTAFLTVQNIEAGRRKYDVFKVNEDAEYHESMINDKL